MVYPAGALPFGSQGTATLFLDDVRISTNVRLFGDGHGGSGEARAIGTRVSQAVRAAVLEQGRPWLGRAFVVNDWYVSGYQPLLDAGGQRVGMLYVGFLEQPYRWLKWGVLAGIGVLFFGVMIVAAIGSSRLARRIFRPIEQMDHTMQQVEAGALQARVGAVASGDELGALAGHLDRLLEALAERNQRLQQWNTELDAKVAQRGAALAAAQQQLLRSEKMATVGQLTASIAHEVNNPIAVIQGNLDLVRELLGADAQRVAGELRLVDEQIERMRLIVTQLLQFARPNEYAGYVEPVDTARALDDSLVLVKHLLVSTRIEVRRALQASRPVGINRQELQQVLVNLIVNAIHAMPEGGTLRLATSDWADAQGRAGVRIEVSDSGPGLDEGLLGELFQPFVTRKKDGTGLGLWISRGIVERYGGDIVASNRPGGGAAMCVLLLCEPGLTTSQVAQASAGPPQAA
ncbi:sensor histidine kinase [Aquabacterium sp. OR-4]|uniref:sensor histidine kinase n=1 Tax=Aquabacterium sp. OR-4 TaxID=2978127 RepID=UPI0028C8E402|nr:cache domain-containing protein [Aquabacterium sp. OR-4]MDT7836397.1 cache domain-containing protein [Aquabacterium sp. OR-4]